MDSIIKKAYTLRAQRSKIPITYPTPTPPLFLISSFPLHYFVYYNSSWECIRFELCLSYHSIDAMRYTHPHEGTHKS